MEGEEYQAGFFILDGVLFDEHVYAGFGDIVGSWLGFSFGV